MHEESPDDKTQTVGSPSGLSRMCLSPQSLGFWDKPGGVNL